MHPLAKEAVENNDLAMCRRIVMIFLQLGNDYILPMIDNSNELKDQLLNVGKEDYSSIIRIVFIVLTYDHDINVLFPLPFPYTYTYTYTHTHTSLSLSPNHQTLFTLYSFPSMEIAELCVDFWIDLITVLSVPEPNSPVYALLNQLVNISLSHLSFPEVGEKQKEKEDGL